MPGFENIPAIVAAAASLRAVHKESEAENPRLSALVDRIRARVPELVPDVEVVGDPVERLPHLVTFSCLYTDGEALLSELDRLGSFAVSSGSSCTSSTLTPSHVLRAMGVLSEGNIRVSLPSGTAEEDVDRFLDLLPRAVRAVRDRLEAPQARPVDEESRAGEAVSGGETGGPVPEAPALVVDTLGRRCPIPVIELAKQVEEVPTGSLIAVLSDDEAARLDIPAWCTMRSQEYVGERPATAFGAPGGTAYLVRRLS